jgi:hypothetical protein
MRTRKVIARPTPRAASTAPTATTTATPPDRPHPVRRGHRPRRRRHRRRLLAADRRASRRLVGAARRLHHPPGYRRHVDPDDLRTSAPATGTARTHPGRPLTITPPRGLDRLRPGHRTRPAAGPHRREGGWPPVAEPAWATPRTETPSTPRRAPAPPVLTRPSASTPSPPTSTASILAGATGARRPGQGASAQVLQPGHSLVAAALGSRCAKAVQSGYGGRWELVLIIGWFAGTPAG